MAKRISDAEWRGDLKNGAGTLKLGSGAFEGRYSYNSRFEDGPGTNPEELIAAAHAACFSMARRRRCPRRATHRHASIRKLRSISARYREVSRSPASSSKPKAKFPGSTPPPSSKSLRQPRRGAPSRRRWWPWKSAWWPSFDSSTAFSRRRRVALTRKPRHAARKNPRARRSV